MLKFAKVVNDETKQCDVGIGNNSAYYQQQQMSLLDVEQAENGNWYLSGFLPKAPEKTYIEKRLAEYPVISDQLDMIYWDKINGTNLWQEKITEIKLKYPKI